MTAQFLVRPIPFSDEKIDSYVMRLTAANKVSRIYKVYELAGLIKGKGNKMRNLNMITDHSVSFEKLSELTTVEQGKLESLTFYDCFGRYSIDRPGEVRVFLEYGLNKTIKRVCPLCLMEEQYLRKRWDLTLYTCCHLHNCLMINRCQDCYHYIYVSDPEICICKCGYDLRQMPVTFIPDSETRLSRILSDKLDYSIQDESSTNPILKKDLLALINALIKISIKIENFDKEKKIILSDESGISKEHKLAMNLFEILLLWPESLLDLATLIIENLYSEKNSLIFCRDFISYNKMLDSGVLNQKLLPFQEDFEEGFIMKWIVLFKDLLMEKL